MEQQYRVLGSSDRAREREEIATRSAGRALYEQGRAMDRQGAESSARLAREGKIATAHRRRDPVVLRRRCARSTRRPGYRFAKENSRRRESRYSGDWPSLSARWQIQRGKPVSLRLLGHQ